MAVYQKKLTTVDAEQWYPGKKLSSLTERPAEIVRSRDGHYYYASVVGLRSTVWLSIKKYPGPVAEEGDRIPGILGPERLTINHPNGNVYTRIVYAFAFFDMQSGFHEPMFTCQDTDLWQDYASAMNWPQKVPVSVGLLETSAGRVIVNPGDWIIVDDLGNRSACSEAAFQEMYEAVGA